MTKEARRSKVKGSGGSSFLGFVVGHSSSAARLPVEFSVMQKHSWVDIAAGLLIAAFGSALAAGSNARYTVNVWTTDEGLPQNVVMAMTQTRDGYLWLGTLDGLVRFDGIGHAAGAGRTQFAVFGENNTPGLNSSRIFKLFEDSQGNLWIGTETAGVVLVSKDGKVTSIDIGRGGRKGVLRAA